MQLLYLPRKNVAKIIYSENAKNELDNIVKYVAEFNPKAAKKVKAKIIKAAKQLSENPMIGHKREDITAKPLRFWAIYSYAIVYMPIENGIKVVNVISNYRDIKNII
jgi:toxin ParE1/3/4